MHHIGLHCIIVEINSLNYFSKINVPNCFALHHIKRSILNQIYSIIIEMNALFQQYIEMNITNTSISNTSLT
jgi:hypothetical protein